MNAGKFATRPDGEIGRRAAFRWQRSKGCAGSLPDCVTQAGNPVLVLTLKFQQLVFVFVIQSLMDQKWYCGMAIDPTKRLAEHNKGKNRFTKGHKPWKIIYSEPHPDWQTARVREKYLKTNAGKIWLKKYLSIN